jgi:hypothetical protein
MARQRMGKLSVRAGTDDVLRLVWLADYLELSQGEIVRNLIEREYDRYSLGCTVNGCARHAAPGSECCKFHQVQPAPEPPLDWNTEQLDGVITGCSGRMGDDPEPPELCSYCNELARPGSNFCPKHEAEWVANRHPATGDDLEVQS